LDSIGHFGKRIALVAGMCRCRSKDGLGTDGNRVAQVALFIEFFEGDWLPASSFFSRILSFLSSLKNCLYGSKNEQVAQNETF
jgi:hypothetical protein